MERIKDSSWGLGLGQPGEVVEPSTERGGLV